MRTYAIICVPARLEVATAQGKNKATAVKNYCERDGHTHHPYDFKALTARELDKFYGR